MGRRRGGQEGRSPKIRKTREEKKTKRQRPDRKRDISREPGPLPINLKLIGETEVEGKKRASIAGRSGP